MISRARGLFSGKALRVEQISPSAGKEAPNPLFLPEFGSFLALYRNSGTQLMMLTHVCPVGSGTEVGNHLPEAVSGLAEK